jgi:hypothetical protein
MALIRVKLPAQLQILAGVGSEIELEVEEPATKRVLLNKLEARYPMIRGTIRDHITGQRRPYLRFFACQEDISDRSADDPLPREITEGSEPFYIVGAISGG